MLNQDSEYRIASRQLLAQGFTELASGDARQASEKGWGAAAQMLKAVAEQRGWQHNSHGALYRVVDRLVQETGDREIRTLFGAASGLHTNFYENWASSDSVEGWLQDMERALGQVRARLAGQSTRANDYHRVHRERRVFCSPVAIRPDVYPREP